MLIRWFCIITRQIMKEAEKPNRLVPLLRKIARIVQEAFFRDGERLDSILILSALTILDIARRISTLTENSRNL